MNKTQTKKQLVSLVERLNELNSEFQYLKEDVGKHVDYVLQNEVLNLKELTYKVTSQCYELGLGLTDWKSE